MARSGPDSGFNCFQNLHPTATEQKIYCGPPNTGSSGDAFATISLLPLTNGHGGVLILQGLQQEGTQAAGLMLADAKGREQLQQALGISGASTQPVYFEALIRTKSMDGVPMATPTIVATRLYHP